MKRTRIALAFVACGVLAACDARITPQDGRQGPPSRAAWLEQLGAPGRFDAAKQANASGALLRLQLVGAPGSYDVWAKASGTSCAGPDGNAPVVEVRADDIAIVKWAVLPGSLARYATELRLTGKPRRLDFWFTNGFQTADCRRSVILHSVELRHAASSE